MKVAVMQPYLFPYMGYLQLVGAVNTFVFFDDVNFIKKGWINRNRILVNDQPFTFTVPLKNASQNKLINEIEIHEYDQWRKEFVKQLEFNYKRAPQFEFVRSWMNSLLSKPFERISDLAAHSIKSIAGYLDMKTNFIASSELNYKDEKCIDGQSKVLKICGMLRANDYINPRNGTDLYEHEHFSRSKVNLHFINMNSIEYLQHKNGLFVPNLSFVDVMMFNSKETIKDMMSQFTLSA